jgi:hypothetical protein
VIDAVAEAIYRSRPRRIEWEDLTEKGWRAEYLRMAEAAVEALGLSVESKWAQDLPDGGDWPPLVREVRFVSQWRRESDSE